MIVFANTITPRLLYIFDFILGETIDEPFKITSDREQFRQYPGARINYSGEVISGPEFRVACSGLLFEQGIAAQVIQCFEVNGYKAFFRTNGDFPFDIFAAAFYLLSRYEEYLPNEKDGYGRYAHVNSLAFRENFLHLPLVNTWMGDFTTLLRARFPALRVKHQSFRFVPTYDIDEAYAYKSKQWWRTAGGFMKPLFSGRLSPAVERINVLLGKKKDPYDSFDWLNRLNKQYGLRPVYFFLVAGRTRRYDKNILPHKKIMQELIIAHSRIYPVGIHPSWQSGDDAESLRFELLKLGHITGQPIRISRQHFIRFGLPHTYRQLIELGIESEYSMGYGSINGFRASVTTPFFWYDLEREEKTKLMLFPFCFMDANSLYEQKFSPEQALAELERFYLAVAAVRGTFVTIWHNPFFGTAREFDGWKQVFEQFISQLPNS